MTPISLKQINPAENDCSYKYNNCIDYPPCATYGGVKVPMFSYAYQPIFKISPEARVLHGYEALMRPPKCSPMDIINCARDRQDGLHGIEFSSFYNAIIQFKYSDHLNGQLFINSLPCELLTDKEMDMLITMFREDLEGVTVEILEYETLVPEVIRQRLSLREEYGAKIAIDDFCTGNNDHTLVRKICPDYIKIDKQFIRNIDTDRTKQNLLLMFIDTAKSVDAQVIAEGVETKEEYDFLKGVDGVDYVQGYYTGRPA